MNRLFLLLLLGTTGVLPLSAQQCLSGNCHNGNGVYLYKSGARYIGGFNRSQRDGFGTCFYTNGDKYTGYWNKDLQHGEGIRYSPKGREMRGVWRQGKLVREELNLVLDPYGAARNVQTGCISGDCKAGTGIYIYPDGTIYSGEFWHGRRNGTGICYYADNSRYQGSWENDLPNGNGTMTYVGGNKTTGYWSQGRLSRVAQARSAPAAKKKGCIEGDCTNGFGTFQYEDGSKYTGAFRAGYPNGHGAIFYPGGERFVGMMQDGKLHGKGTLYYADGRTIAGYWENGKYVQSGNMEAPKPFADPQPEQEPERKVKIWAVIIGVSTYEHMKVLRYTDDDAYRFFAFLKSPQGGAVADEQIKILIDEDATHRKILQNMRQVFGRAGENDLVVLYFSGHGLPGAFLPIDFDGYNNKLFHQEINQIMTQSRARYKLCIADACHSGSMLASRSGDIDEYLVDNYYRTLAQAQPGTALIMSSKSEETSLEASGLRQGVFSHYLIRGLKGDADINKDKDVTIQELFNFVYHQVRHYTGNLQSPIIRGDYDREMVISKY